MIWTDHKIGSINSNQTLHRSQVIELSMLLADHDILKYASSLPCFSTGVMA